MAIPPPAVCDAEYHVGLVPYDFSDSVAAANTAKLNGALNAMWTDGSFPFASGGAGPILRPIVAAAKEFYFKGTIKTSRKIGGGLIGSMLSRGFSTTSSSYQFANLHPYPN